MRKALILANSATITETGAGTTVANHIEGRAWVAFLTVGGSSGTTPTLDVTFQHSADGTNWVTLIAMTQATGATTEHKFAAAATDYLKPLLPYVRISSTIGGTDTPTFTGVTARLYIEPNT